LKIGSPYLNYYLCLPLTSDLKCNRVILEFPVPQSEAVELPPNFYIMALQKYLEIESTGERQSGSEIEVTENDMVTDFNNPL
jgi:hypothetical protein